MTKEKIYIFDTTLRDGAQTEGVDFSIEDKNKIIGCMGYLPSKKNEIEIHKLYIDQKFRRKGLAKLLVQKVENIAMRENKSKVILWTDTRFKEAHKMYLKMDYEKSKKTRRLYDISGTVEYNFVKNLR